MADKSKAGARVEVGVRHINCKDCEFFADGGAYAYPKGSGRCGIQLPPAYVFIGPFSKEYSVEVYGTHESNGCHLGIPKDEGS